MRFKSNEIHSLFSFENNENNNQIQRVKKIKKEGFLESSEMPDTF